MVQSYSLGRLSSVPSNKRRDVALPTNLPVILKASAAKTVKAANTLRQSRNASLPE